MSGGAIRPRVLLAVDEFKAGGVTTVMLDLAIVLRETVDVEFAAFSAGPWLDRVQALGLPVTIVSPWRMVALMRHFDVVHSHDRGLGLLAIVTGQRSRLIEHVHGPYHDRPRLSFRGRYVVAVSNAVADWLRLHNRHVRRASLSVVRNAAPPSLLLYPHPRPRPSNLLAVGVGRLVEQKDPLTFLQLARALHDLDPAFRAVWVGDGPLTGAFLGRRDQLGLAEVVAWEELPPRERTVDLIATASVLVLTSRWEGFPMVALEAAALSTPIATTECGDITDEVDRLGMGVVLRGDRAEPAVVAAWATAVHDLWEDETAWLGASDRAKRAAAHRFSMDVLRREILDVYDAVLTARTRGRSRAQRPLLRDARSSGTRAHR